MAYPLITAGKLIFKDGKLVTLPAKTTTDCSCCTPILQLVDCVTGEAQDLYVTQTMAAGASTVCYSGKCYALQIPSPPPDDPTLVTATPINPGCVVDGYGNNNCQSDCSACIPPGCRGGDVIYTSADVTIAGIEACPASPEHACRVITSRESIMNINSGNPGGLSGTAKMYGNLPFGCACDGPSSTGLVKGIFVVVLGSPFTSTRGHFYFSFHEGTFPDQGYYAEATGYFIGVDDNNFPFIEAACFDGTGFVSVPDFDHPPTTLTFSITATQTECDEKPNGLATACFFGGTATVVVTGATISANCPPSRHGCPCAPIPPGAPQCDCPSFSFSTASEVKELCANAIDNIYTSGTAVIPMGDGDTVTVDGTLDDILVMIDARDDVTGSYDAMTEKITYTIPANAILFNSTHGNFSLGSTTGDVINMETGGTACCKKYKFTIGGGTPVDGVHELEYHNADADAAVISSADYWFQDNGGPFFHASGHTFGDTLFATGTFGWEIVIRNPSDGNTAKFDDGNNDNTICPAKNAADYTQNGGTDYADATLDAVEIVNCGCWNIKSFTGGGETVTITDPGDTTTSTATFAANGWNVKSFGDALTTTDLFPFTDFDTKCASVKFVYIVSGTGFATGITLTCGDGM